MTIIWESWRNSKKKLQKQCPKAKIKYSYKTKQFTILYDLPSNFKIITRILKK